MKYTDFKYHYTLEIYNKVEPYNEYFEVLKYNDEQDIIPLIRQDNRFYRETYNFTGEYYEISKMGHIKIYDRDGPITSEFITFRKLTD